MDIATDSAPTDEERRKKDLIQGPADVEWRYEMRRECQEILPNLWLGSFVVSKSAETLHSLGITHVVCIRDITEAFSVKPRFPDQFKYLVLDVKDSEEQNLIRLFPTAKGFIDKAIAEGGKVLVHCNGGISMSPAFVVMFVMQQERLSWEEALHMVQNRRYCISPNGGFLTQLKEYEAIYRASHAVKDYPTRPSGAIQRRKRQDDESDTDEDERVDRKRTLVGEHHPVHIPVPAIVQHDPNAMEVS